MKKKYLIICMLILLTVTTLMSCSSTASISDINDEAVYGGGNSGCIHDSAYNESYHHITGALMDFVGSEAYMKWREEAIKLSEENKTEQCDFAYLTISYFIEYFDINREDFEKLYENTIYYNIVDYNVDVLYSGNKDKIEHYYREQCKDNIQEMEFRAELREFKVLLVEKIFENQQNDDYKSWVKSLDKDNVIEWMETNMGNEDGFYLTAESLWSIPEFVYDCDVSEADFKSCVEIRNMNTNTKYDYGIEKIYTDNKELKNAIENSADIKTIDELILTESRVGEVIEDTVEVESVNGLTEELPTVILWED